MIVRPLAAALVLSMVLLETGCGCHSLARRGAPAPAIVNAAPFAPAGNPNCPDPVPPAPTPVPSPVAPTTAIPGGYR
ncbi:MAG: hypothetical protein L0Z62_41340 [Gemmataceae bacterium]|nr:hypothetical protein [Gemmataceae bacterium]